MTLSVDASGEIPTFAFKFSGEDMPLAEAAELYGTIMLPVVFLPLRGVEYLVSLLTKDPEPTPCLIGQKQ
jgi:hypothetical protein